MDIKIHSKNKVFFLNRRKHQEKNKYFDIFLFNQKSQLISNKSQKKVKKKKEFKDGKQIDFNKRPKRKKTTLYVEGLVQDIQPLSNYSYKNELCVIVICF